MAVQIQVVGVVVVPRDGRIGRPWQSGPAAFDARDPLAVEVGHQLGAAHTPSGGRVPRDHDAKTATAPANSNPGGLAASPGDQHPGANPGGREDHQPEPLVQPDRPGPFGGLPVEAAGALRVSAAGCPPIRCWGRVRSIRSSQPLTTYRRLSSRRRDPLLLLFQLFEGDARPVIQDGAGSPFR